MTKRRRYDEPFCGLYELRDEVARVPARLAHQRVERTRALQRLRREAERDELHRSIEATNYLLAQYYAEVAEEQAIARARQVL